MEEKLRARACALATALWLAAPAAAAPPEKQSLLLSRLRTRIEAVERSTDGVLGVVVKDLTSGETVVALHADEPFATASTIKLAILYELYRQAEAGTIDLREVTRPPLPRVAGGVLARLGDHVTLDWRDLATLMMVWSDNEAANLLAARVGRDNVNTRLDALGLHATRLRRRMMDLDAARRGNENVSTPAELLRLVETVRSGPQLSPERAKDMAAVASIEKDSPFRTGLPEGLRVIDKPGELEGVRAVAAVVELPGRPYAVSVMSAYLRHDEDGDAAIRAISAAAYDTFDRLARSSDVGRIISER
jgi:beta-lactamase class A